MRIKTNLYGIFYKNRGKWTGPYMGELFNSPLEIVAAMPDITSKLRKPWKLMQQVFEFKN